MESIYRISERAMEYVVLRILQWMYGVRDVERRGCYSPMPLRLLHVPVDPRTSADILNARAACDKLRNISVRLKFTSDR